MRGGDPVTNGAAWYSSARIRRVSCVVALADLTGAPADRIRLVHAASVPPYEGARACASLDGSVALAAAPLPRKPAGVATARAPGHDDAVRVVFDGRLDDRTDLRRRLTSHLTGDPQAASDADLVRAAYQRWGLDAAAHLTGDFAWCLWDGRERRLVCARDHFGIRPLYFARTARMLVISNTVDSLRRAGVATERLRDRAVGDLLLFGDPMEPGETALADVDRVPAAHVLMWTASAGVTLWRYWRLQPPPHPSPHEEAASRIRATLQHAVDERIAGERATVLMSGGLDSTSVAALAARRANGGSVRALTSVHRGLPQDREEHFAGLASEALGLPWETLSLDGYELFGRWDADAGPPLPRAEPPTAVRTDLRGRAAAHGGVALSGDGGDPLLLPATLPRHIGRMPLVPTARGVWRLWRDYRQPPLLGLRSTWRRLRAAEAPPPRWLATPLRAAYDAGARRHEVEAAGEVERGVLRREAVRQLRSPWWPSLFESLHPAATRQPVDVRYPFFDRRVVEAALALPSYPWCVGKIVLREAMADRLPEAVRLRPKTPFAGDPVAMRRRMPLDEAVRLLRAAPDLDRFVDADAFAATVRPAGLLLDDEPGTLAALSLALWLTRGSRCPTI
jgi:asparagine synthase (glutamine-hydrolysing)